MTDNLEELERLLEERAVAYCYTWAPSRALLRSLIATAREVEGLRAEVARLEKAGRYLMPYLTWTIGAESPGYHPTIPSAVAAFRAALEGAEAPQSPIPLELKPIHFRLLERGANSRYIGLSNNSGVRMGEHAALGQLMRAGLVRFTEDSQPPGPRMPTPCEITDAGRAALNGKGG